jgi:hypothetical protein
MSIPLPPSSQTGDSNLVASSGQSSQVPGAGSAAAEQSSTAPARPVAQSVGQVDSGDWKNLALDKLDDVSTHIPIQSKGGLNFFLPDVVDVRKFTLGVNGPSIQIAQNIGATPIQITTADGKDLLTSVITSDNYIRELNGAGSVGGIPIVGPAGRLAYGKDHEPTVYLNNMKQVDIKPAWIGKLGRIATAKNDALGKEILTHGPLFTSDKWKLTAMRTKADKGIELTYTLPLHDEDSDVVVDAFVDNQVAIEGSAGLEPPASPGKIEAKYTFELDDNGNPKFNSDIRIDPGEGNMMLLGSLAQHTFLASDKGDTLQTNATKEYAAPDDRPELPTGELINVKPENDFSTAKVVHKDVEKKIQTVLTGYEGPVEAVLARTNGLKIISKAGHDYDGFLLCNYGDSNVMLEPIAKAPNIINTNPENALLPTGENKARFTYELSLAA